MRRGVSGDDFRASRRSELLLNNVALNGCSLVGLVSFLYQSKTRGLNALPMKKASFSGCEAGGLYIFVSRKET